jgi:hypothetical protein
MQKKSLVTGDAGCGKLIKIFSLIFFLSIITSCGQREVDNLDQHPGDQTKCDTTILFVLQLISSQEKIDPIIGSKKLVPFDEFNPNDVNNPIKIPILNEFKDSLEFDRLKEIGEDESFLNSLIMRGNSAKICENDFLFIDEKQLHELLEKEQQNYEFRFAFYILSYPFFSPDGNLFIIEVDYLCSLMCGYGSTFIFEKKMGKWTLKKEVFRWVN